MKKTQLCINLVLLLFFNLHSIVAQNTRIISGVVTTAGKFPLYNVSVTAQKSAIKVFTDSSGFFQINCADNDIIVISAGGFREKRIKTSKMNDHSTDLPYVDNVSNFDKAVSGGHISEKNLKNVIDQNLKKTGKDYSKYNSVFELVSSEIYQVSVRGSAVYNKSVRSMDSNPLVLYVVDDKIVPDISYINTSDVKSIEFIDDVGATMYGSRGANGVLKIFLK